MGHPGKKDVKRIYGLLVDDLKVYQKNLEGRKRDDRTGT